MTSVIVHLLIAAVKERTDMSEPPAIDPGYDPFHAPQLEDPYPFFALAREQTPVFYSDEVKHWVVARRADILEIFMNTENFSASNSISPITELSPRAQQILREGGWGLQPALGNNDRPEHTRFRKSVNKAFTARRVAELEPFIRTSVQRAIEDFSSARKVDLVSALLWELSARVILHLLGIPEDGVPIGRLSRPDSGDVR
jgi:cytochrome P450